VAKFTILTPLSLLISCKLSFLIFSFEMPSLPTLELNSPNKICMWNLASVLKNRVPHRSCPSHHQFYPLLGHECSEKLHMYDNLSLETLTLLTANIDSLFAQKHLHPIHDSHSPFHRKYMYSPDGSVPLLSHLISCIPTKSNLYLNSSF
jgi:hypothetical protein